MTGPNNCRPGLEAVPLEAELIAAGLLDELAAVAESHRVMVTITFAPYDDPDESGRAT